MPDPPNEMPNYSGKLWGWLAAFAVCIFLAAQCSSAKKSPDEAPAQFVSLPTAVPTPAATTALPPPISELASADLRHGRTAFAKVAALGDAAAAVAYSKNCYATLAETFAWPKLDRCGAFDAMAAHNALTETFNGSAEEAAYLESESAAQRYLSAGTSHGAMPPVMDERWVSVSGFATAAAAAAAETAAPMDDIVEEESSATEASPASESEAASGSD